MAAAPFCRVPAAVLMHQSLCCRLPDGAAARQFDHERDIVAFDLVLVMDKFCAADVLREVRLTPISTVCLFLAAVPGPCFTWQLSVTRCRHVSTAANCGFRRGATTVFVQVSSHFTHKLQVSVYDTINKAGNYSRKVRMLGQYHRQLGASKEPDGMDINDPLYGNVGGTEEQVGASIAGLWHSLHQ